MSNFRQTWLSRQFWILALEFSELSYPFHAIDLSTVHRCARIALSYQLMCLLLFVLSGWCFDIRTEFGPQTGFTLLISVRSLWKKWVKNLTVKYLETTVITFIFLFQWQLHLQPQVLGDFFEKLLYFWQLVEQKQQEPAYWDQTNIIAFASYAFFRVTILVLQTPLWKL